MKKKIKTKIKTKVENRLCGCDNCGWQCWESDMPQGLAGIPDLWERLDPGGVVPAGECPRCGALSYLIKPKH